ncbi:hypothetical protein ACP70R_030461 [Stipagrostis hirtigluma subsp. patula]
MVTPVDSALQLPHAPEDIGAAACKTSKALWVRGLCAAAMAITLAVLEPSPGLDNNTYYIALAGAFFAGVAGVIAAVWVADDPAGRHLAGRRLVYASIVPLAVAAGLSVASVLGW